MLRVAIFFCVLSLIFALAGFSGLAAAFAAFAKILFFLCVLLFVVFLVLALFIKGAISQGTLKR